MSIVITDGTNTITLSGDTHSDSISNIVLPDSDSSSTSGVRNIHEWKVRFNNVELDSDYCVTLTATPSDGSGALTSTLSVDSFPDSEFDGWSCFLLDDTTENINTFDAFNYMITGSGGTSIKFSYDATKLEINPVFLAYNTEASLKETYQGTESGSHTGWKTVEITVQENVNRYNLQMYKVGSNSPANWNIIKPENKNWVEFEIQSASEP